MPPDPRISFNRRKLNNFIYHHGRLVLFAIPQEMLFTGFITLVPLLLTFHILCAEKFTQVTKLTPALSFQTRCFHFVHNENQPGKLKSSPLLR